MTSDAPSVIRGIDWILNVQNWRRHWIAILTGLLLLLASALGIFPKLLNDDFKLTVPVANTLVSNSSGIPESDYPVTLPNEETRGAIEKALNQGDVEETRKLLSGLVQGSVKTEECEHVFDYTIKNTRLDDAKKIVAQCWVGEEKQEKLMEIWHESLKQQ